MSSGLLYQWVKKYQELGAQGLENRKKTGNPYAALHISKSPGKLERLELTVAKQRVEIARLKNGCQVKGGGQHKVFVTLSGASTKSSES